MEGIQQEDQEADGWIKQKKNKFVSDQFLNIFIIQSSILACSHCIQFYQLLTAEIPQ